MSKVILSFDGKYRFLSNFYVADITYGGKIYSSAEHAYQAAKTSDEKQQELIRSAASPGGAKRLGRWANLIPEWEEVKYDVMWNVLWNKFHKSQLEIPLLDTGDAILIEGNHWHDNTWGVCHCDKCGVGENHLGRLLMKLREELK